MSNLVCAAVTVSNLALYHLRRGSVHLGALSSVEKQRGVPEVGWVIHTPVAGIYRRQNEPATSDRGTHDECACEPP